MGSEMCIRDSHVTGVADTTPYLTESVFTVAKVKRRESEAVTCRGATFGFGQHLVLASTPARLAHRGVSK